MAVALAILALFAAVFGLPTIVIYHKEIGKKLTPLWRSPDKRLVAGEKILRDLLALHDLDPEIVQLPKPCLKRINDWLVPDAYRARYNPAQRGSYRDLAKLLNDLAHPKSLNEDELVLLPASIQIRTDRWLVHHRHAIEGRRPRALGR